MEITQNRKGRKRIMTILFSILGVIVVLFAIAVIANIYANTPTKGENIAAYGNPKSALLVIDLQNDITHGKPYGDTAGFVESVNQAIGMAEESGMEILYIRTEYTNPLMQFLAGGMFKPSTDGSEFDNRLKLVNDNVFSKSIGDSFSNTAFENYLVSKEVSSLFIVGADAAGCVLRTAKGGKNRNYSVTIIKDAIVSVVSDSKMKQVEEQYAKIGIDAVSLNEVIPLGS